MIQAQNTIHHKKITNEIENPCRCGARLSARGEDFYNIHTHA